MPRSILLALAVLLAACNPYRAAWTTMDGVLKARDVTASTLAVKGQSVHDECIKLHGVKTQAYADCVKVWRNALQKWQRYGRPGITSPVRLAAVSVEIAEKKGNKKLNWKKVMAPIACALSGVGSDWSTLIPDELELLKAAMQGLGAYTCTKSTAAAISATDILGPLGALISWIAKALGEPLEALRRRVKEALSKPLTDATDPVLAQINAAMPEPTPAPPR